MSLDTPAARGAGASERAAALEASDLVVRYRSASRNALDGITLAVPAGTLFAVVGPNGSGKSTLMRAMMGLVRPTRGRVEVEGRAAAAWDRRSLARAVAAVSQSESVTFPMSVRALVGMGRYPHLGPLGVERAADRLAVRTALERCDAVELRDRPVQTLSGGEFQRVRIARALAQEPRTLALDEPTASLDIRHQMAILSLLRQAADARTTVLLITHHLDLAARFADRIAILNEGRLEAEGPPVDVLDDEILTRVYGWPIRVERDRERGTVIRPVAQSSDSSSRTR